MSQRGDHFLMTHPLQFKKMKEFKKMRRLQEIERFHQENEKTLRCRWGSSKHDDADLPWALSLINGAKRGKTEVAYLKIFIYYFIYYSFYV